jgi:hypothetical protein
MIDLLVRNIQTENSSSTIDIAVKGGVIIDRGKGLNYPSTALM